MSPPVLEYSINPDLQLVSIWLTFWQNYLEINASKTLSLWIYGSSGLVSFSYDFNLDSKVVDTTDTLKILVVTLDCKLNFAAQISEQVKDACAEASALRRIRRFIPLDVMGRLYKAYILPHLEYCCSLLLGAGGIQFNLRPWETDTL